MPADPAYTTVDHQLELARFHRQLASLNSEKFSLDSCLTPESEIALDINRHAMEETWLGSELTAVQLHVSDMPTQPTDFIAWLEQLQVNGPGQNHPLFNYLSEKATTKDFEFFMGQELATEAGFDDLVAMTQVQAPHSVKLELGRNYWDELGNGTYDKMHAVQLGWVADALNIVDNKGDYDDVYWQALALSNLMLAFASKRSYFYQSIGALGAIEMTAPARCGKVAQGLQRLGFTNCQYRYYSLHSTLDIKHWNGWRDNVLRPLIEPRPEVCVKIAEGFLLRMIAGQRCYDAYWKHIQAHRATSEASRTDLAFVS